MNKIDSRERENIKEQLKEYYQKFGRLPKHWITEVIRYISRELN